MFLSNSTYANQYTFYGVVFGISFPLFSTLFDSWYVLGGVSFSHIVQAQLEHPLLWVIDTAPLFLGLFARIGGMHYDKLKVSEQEREKLLQALQHDNDELELIVEGRTIELRHAMELAEQAAKTKSEFLATVSHELRTPLNGILGMGQLLKGTKMMEMQEQYVDIILKSGGSLLAIIDDMLDFSRLENKQLALAKTPMDLKSTVKDACVKIEKQCHEKSISLNCEYADDLPFYVIGDAVRIHKLLVNLLENAVKFTNKGSITVAVNCPLYEQGQASFMISVTDTGQGIDPLLMKKLFNSFTQGDATVTRKHGGMGLGLAICKQLVRLMNGEIGVNSEVGKGSTFWINLKLELVQHPSIGTVKQNAG